MAQVLSNACKLSHQCYWLFLITLKKKSCRLRSFIPTIMTFDYNYKGLLNLRHKASKERIWLLKETDVIVKWSPSFSVSYVFCRFDHSNESPTFLKMDCVQVTPQTYPWATRSGMCIFSGRQEFASTCKRPMSIKDKQKIPSLTDSNPRGRKSLSHLRFKRRRLENIYVIR